MEKITLGEIIEKEGGGDFPYIEFRHIIKRLGKEDINYFHGSAKYTDGVLQTIDIESYSLDDEFDKYAVKTADGTYISNLIKTGDRILTVWKFEKWDR